MSLLLDPEIRHLDEAKSLKTKAELLAFGSLSRNKKLAGTLFEATRFQNLSL